jgi:uncharacterized protein
MVKLIILGIIGYVIYKLFWNKKVIDTNFDENDLIECSNCHTFVPKNECKFTQNGCLCKDCQ